jgi:hypothetical protein
VLGPGFYFHYSPWKPIAGPLGTPTHTSSRPLILTHGWVIESLLAKGPPLWEWTDQSLKGVTQLRQYCASQQEVLAASRRDVEEGRWPARMSPPLVLCFSRHQAPVNSQQQEWLCH